MEEFKNWLFNIAGQPINIYLYEDITKRITYLKNIRANPKIGNELSLEIQDLFDSIISLQKKLGVVLFYQHATDQFGSIITLSEKSLSQSVYFLHWIFSASDFTQMSYDLSSILTCRNRQDLEPQLAADGAKAHDYAIEKIQTAKKMIGLLQRVEIIAGLGGNILAYTVLTNEVYALLNEYRDVLSGLIYYLQEVDEFVLSANKKYLQGKLTLKTYSHWPDNYNKAMSFKNSPIDMLTKIKEDVTKIAVELSQQKYSDNDYWNEVRQFISDFQKDVRALLLVSDGKLISNYPPKLIIDQLSCPIPSEETVLHNVVKTEGPSDSTNNVPDKSAELNNNDLSKEANNHLIGVSAASVISSSPIVSSAYGLRPSQLYGVPLFFLMVAMLGIPVLGIEPITAVVATAVAIKAYHDVDKENTYLTWPDYCYQDEMFNERMLIRQLHFKTFNEKYFEGMGFFSDLSNNDPKAGMLSKDLFQIHPWFGVNKCFYHLDFSKDHLTNSKALELGHPILSGPLKELYEKIQNKQHALISTGTSLNDPYILFFEQLNRSIRSIAKTNDSLDIKNEILKIKNYLNEFSSQWPGHEVIRRGDYIKVTDFLQKEVLPALKHVEDTAKHISENSDFLTSISALRKKIKSFQDMMQDMSYFDYNNEKNLFPNRPDSSSKSPIANIAIKNFHDVCSPESDGKSHPALELTPESNKIVLKIKKEYIQKFKEDISNNPEIACRFTSGEQIANYLTVQYLDKILDFAVSTVETMEFAVKNFGQIFAAETLKPQMQEALEEIKLLFKTGIAPLLKEYSTDIEAEISKAKKEQNSKDYFGPNHLRFVSKHRDEFSNYQEEGNNPIIISIINLLQSINNFDPKNDIENLNISGEAKSTLRKMTEDFTNVIRSFKLIAHPGRIAVSADQKKQHQFANGMPTMGSYLPSIEITYDRNRRLSAARETWSYQFFVLLVYAKNQLCSSALHWFNAVVDYFGDAWNMKKPSDTPSSSLLDSYFPKEKGLPFDAVLYDQNPRRDYFTGKPIFTHHVLKNSNKVGSISFYGYPGFCRSENGGRHNVLSQTGAMKDYDINYMVETSEDVCADLPPTLIETLQQAAMQGAKHGVIRGLSSVVGSYIQQVGYSQKTTYYVQFGLYYMAMFLFEMARFYDEKTTLSNTLWQSSISFLFLIAMQSLLTLFCKTAHYVSKEAKQQGYSTTSKVLQRLGDYAGYGHYAYNTVHAFYEAGLMAASQVIAQAITSIHAGILAEKFVTGIGSMTIEYYIKQGIFNEKPMRTGVIKNSPSNNAAKP